MIIRGKKKKKGFVRRSKPKEKKGKFKRREKEKVMPNKQLGGFLPFPPKDCQKKEFITKCFGIKWIDLSICHWCPGIKECITRKEHLNKLKEQRKEYFRNKGIIPHV
jgi:hypothetical protein